ncbi:MAG: hypothetical protein SGJ05_06345 [bacterium]|nr:hypothetical protein [bacterium]
MSLFLCVACAFARTDDDSVFTIRTIRYDQRDVFDSTQASWFFAGSLANAFHTITREYILDDELLFEEGDDADSSLLHETERNLRRTGLFSEVRVSSKRTTTDEVDVLIFTQDRWSLRPAFLFGTGGGISNLGGKLEEINFLGTATRLLVQGLYRTENDIGWEGTVQIIQRRLFRSEVGIMATIVANSVRTEQGLSFVKPYRTTITPWAFGVDLLNAFGEDFTYSRNATPELLPFHVRSAFAWISQAYNVRDQLFISASVRANDVFRFVQASRQAFDNTGHVLVAFSSLRQRYTRSTFLNGYETEDLQEGAWGSATIGRVFSMGNGGESMWYVRGDGEQSGLISNNVYLFGRVAGASGFNRTGGRYTFLETSGIGHWRASDHIVLTSRFQVQTAWNWNAYRQLVLDFQSGLRGYNANGLAGDNRFVGNAEIRWFPGWKAWIFGLSAVAFYDVGTVWQQGTSLQRTQMHHAIGLGIRVHNHTASGADAIYRFDIAYNLDDRRIAAIIFTTNQLFSAFGSHQYRPPDILGKELDLQ